MSLINREDLLDEIEKSLNTITGDGFAATVAKIAFMRAITAIKEAPAIDLEKLLQTGRAMWIPYYNGGLDRREYRCSRCWNGTPNNQDTRCLNCGSEMLREL